MRRRGSLSHSARWAYDGGHFSDRYAAASGKVESERFEPGGDPRQVTLALTTTLTLTLTPTPTLALTLAPSPTNPNSALLPRTAALASLAACIRLGALFCAVSPPCNRRAAARARRPSRRRRVRPLARWAGRRRVRSARLLRAGAERLGALLVEAAVEEEARLAQRGRAATRPAPARPREPARGCGAVTRSARAERAEGCGSRLRVVNVMVATLNFCVGCRRAQVSDASRFPTHLPPAQVRGGVTSHRPLAQDKSFRKVVFRDALATSLARRMARRLPGWRRIALLVLFGVCAVQVYEVVVVLNQSVATAAPSSSAATTSTVQPPLLAPPPPRRLPPPHPPSPTPALPAPAVADSLAEDEARCAAQTSCAACVRIKPRKPPNDSLRCVWCGMASACRAYHKYPAPRRPGHAAPFPCPDALRGGGGYPGGGKCAGSASSARRRDVVSGPAAGGAARRESPAAAAAVLLRPPALSALEPAGEAAGAAGMEPAGLAAAGGERAIWHATAAARRRALGLALYGGGHCRLVGSAKWTDDGGRFSPMAAGAFHPWRRALLLAGQVCRGASAG